ncbi:HD-GYP domain-containing protein [Gottschalkia acidurici]|nr:HD domain-containing phosphohydrolase [Gottschalkia acidurici]
MLKLDKDRDLIDILQTILSKNSKYTWEHSQNVSKYTEILSSRFYNKIKDIQAVSWGALLHDIGKIEISQSIIDKPSEISQEEFTEIRKHPTYSRDILLYMFNKENNYFESDELKIILDIAYYHHERWDGEGYPQGLKGERIPLSARIVSVIDTYDAIVAERPYKESKSSEEAIYIIKNEAGKQFDPNVVKEFIECFE